MRMILADAGFWIGLRDKRDFHHASCLKIAQWVIHQRMHMLITPFIFAEVYACFSRVPPIREQLVRDMWDNKIVRIEQPTVQDQDRAVALLKRFADKNYSFTDALSFVLMDRLKLSEAISFDDHFRQIGTISVIDGSNL